MVVAVAGGRGAEAVTDDGASDGLVGGDVQGQAAVVVQPGQDASRQVVWTHLSS